MYNEERKKEYLRHVVEDLGEGFMRFALVEPVPVMQEIVKAIAESGLLKRQGE